MKASRLLWSSVLASFFFLSPFLGWFFLSCCFFLKKGEEVALHRLDLQFVQRWEEMKDFFFLDPQGSNLM